MALLSAENQEKAKQFVDRIKSGAVSSTQEPLTPEIVAAVEASIDEQDEANKVKIRAALRSLREKTKFQEKNNDSLSPLFEGTHSDLMRQAPKIANEVMEDALKLWKGPPLTPEQKENIKLAIIDRVASGAFAQAMLGGIHGKIDKMQGLVVKFGDSFKGRKIDDISASELQQQADKMTKEFSGTESEKTDGAPKSMEEKITEQVIRMMQDGLGDIQKAHEGVPQPTGYTLLLTHPKALANYKYGMDIPALLQASGDAQGTKEIFKNEIKAKIQKLEAQIIGMEQSKERIFNTIARIPEFASNKLFEMMEWIFKIPIFGKFAAAFLGFDDPKTAIDELKIETKQRKSIHTLISFGVSKNEKGELRRGDNYGKLGILKDVDFTGVDFVKLKPFMKKMKENGIDVSHADFWKDVFVDGKIEAGEGEKKKTLTFPKWEEGKETAETIVSKLNGRTTVLQAGTPSGASANPSNTPIAGATQAATVAVGAGTTSMTESISEAPKTREAALTKAFNQASSLPFDFKYNNKTETVKFENGSLLIGEQSYILHGKKRITVDIIGVNIIGLGISFDHLGGPTIKPKTLIAQNLPELLNMNTNSIKEVASDGSSLIIKRLT